jgi:hypothetical protein
MGFCGLMVLYGSIPSRASTFQHASYINENSIDKFDIIDIRKPNWPRFLLMLFDTRNCLKMLGKDMRCQDSLSFAQYCFELKKETKDHDRTSGSQLRIRMT